MSAHPPASGTAPAHESRPEKLPWRRPSLEEIDYAATESNNPGMGTVDGGLYGT